MAQNGWIGLDWGTSNLRAFIVDSSGEVRDERISDKGMGKLESNQFEPAFLEIAGDWLDPEKPLPVYACGMVGARQGWIDAGYRSIPCTPVADCELKRAPTRNPLLNVYIMPGLSQTVPADIMRGEETQVAGFLTMEPGYEGAVCLPGTHSKWVLVDAGIVQGFSTFMTGELFSILSQHSVLRHNYVAGGWDHASFLEAALRAAEQPALAATELFSVRAAGMLSGESKEKASARLSGLLIGQELGLAKDYWLDKEVAIIGSNEVALLYRDVLDALEADTVLVDTRSATLAGLAMAAKAGTGKSA